MTEQESDRIETPLPRDIYEALEAEAQRQGISADDLANKIMEQFLAWENFERRVREHFERECPELIAKYNLFRDQDSRVH